MPYTLCTGPLLLANRLRMEALVKRGVRSGLCAADTPNWTELSESSDDAPFNRVLCNQDHILFPLLPDKRHFTYNLRKRNHNRLLTIKQGRLCSCNFITRMLFKACYWLCSTSFYSRYFSRIYMYYCVIVAFCQHVLNEHAMLCFNDNFFYIFTGQCPPAEPLAGAHRTASCSGESRLKTTAMHCVSTVLNPVVVRSCKGIRGWRWVQLHLLSHCPAAEWHRRC